VSETPADLPNWLRWAVWAIQQVGFPIAVCVYVLYRLNGKIGALTDAMLAAVSAFRDLKTATDQHAAWSRDAVAEIRQELREARR